MCDLSPLERFFLAAWEAYGSGLDWQGNAVEWELVEAGLARWKSTEGHGGIELTEAGQAVASKKALA